MAIVRDWVVYSRAFTIETLDPKKDRSGEDGPRLQLLQFWAGAGLSSVCTDGLRFVPGPDVISKADSDPERVAILMARHAGLVLGVSVLQVGPCIGRFATIFGSVAERMGVAIEERAFVRSFFVLPVARQVVQRTLVEETVRLAGRMGARIVGYHLRTQPSITAETVLDWVGGGFGPTGREAEFEVDAPELPAMLPLVGEEWGREVFPSTDPALRHLCYQVRIAATPGNTLVLEDGEVVGIAAE